MAVGEGRELARPKNIKGAARGAQEVCCMRFFHFFCAAKKISSEKSASKRAVP